ncbi:hypothetical protein D9M68_708430 [compost metagenome]
MAQSLEADGRELPHRPAQVVGQVRAGRYHMKFFYFQQRGVIEPVNGPVGQHGLQRLEFLREHLVVDDQRRFSQAVLLRQNMGFPEVLYKPMVVIWTAATAQQYG